MLGSVRGVVSNGHLYRDKRVQFRGADLVRRREGNISHGVLACMGEPRAVGDLAHVEKGPVAGLVGIEGGVVSGVTNLESPGVEVPGRRPRHEECYQQS